MLLRGNLIAENGKAGRKKGDNGKGTATRKNKTENINGTSSEPRNLPKCGIISETLKSRIT